MQHEYMMMATTTGYEGVADLRRKNGLYIKKLRRQPSPSCSVGRERKALDLAVDDSKPTVGVFAPFLQFFKL